MASIEKRIGKNGELTHRVKIRLKGYPAQTATFSRLTDARKWIQDTESAIRGGRHFKQAESKKHTLAELIDRYIEEILPRKPKSLLDQKQQLLWWRNKIGSYLLSDITPALIIEYRNKLGQEKTKSGNLRTSSTLNRYVAPLRHAFSIATREWYWIDDNPVKKVSKLPEPRGRVRFLSDEERQNLLNVCKEHPVLYLVVVLALSTGARKMEILSLKWDDVSFQRKAITLHETKNNERRLLPLTGLALNLMLDYSKIRRLNSALVFSGKNSKTPINIRRPWEKALQEAKIEDFRFHDLRHSAASYLAMNGATSAEIAEVLGHKTLQMVKRYAHLSETHTARVVESMNNKIFGV